MRQSISVGLEKYATHLSQTHMHERQIVHDVPPYANHAYRTAPSCDVPCRAHTALHARALQHRIRRQIFSLIRAQPLRVRSFQEQLPYLLSIPTRVQLGVDLIRPHAGNVALGELEAARLQVSNNKRVGAGGARGGQGEQADGARAADKSGAAEPERRGGDAVHDDGQRLEQGRFGEGDGRGELVAPARRVHLEALQRAGVRVDAREGDGGAEVVASRVAEEAAVARHAGFEGDAVARAQVGDGGVGAQDDAGGFVAEDAVAVDGEGADAAAVPEVDVGAVAGGELGGAVDFFYSFLLLTRRSRLS